MDTVGYVLVALAVIVMIFLWMLTTYKRKLLGYLDISSESIEFNVEKYGNIIHWDKHCLFINNKPTFIVSGEFHYWRLPDRERWVDILKKYKTAGLNCIRIYFHWGFHSPSEGKYVFDGNRDIKYLMDICVSLGLFVLAAPGPYICAETSAGGLPFWLLNKKVRIRHAKYTFIREYDPAYSFYCEQWFEHVLPILKEYQITENSQGCLIALQIENESLEELFKIPLGCHDDMRHLSKAARDLGITVPLFTNDAIEAGSFNKRTTKSKKFGLDLYGFDKYVIFAPVSQIWQSLLGGAAQRKVSQWGEWSHKEFSSSVDSMEHKVRQFGHEAAQTPIFIPELQGGWFNHYTLSNTYDDIYRFYGETFTKTIFDSVLAQGCNLLNFYMFYGGTNWGMIGDPDVYTSYDYSACIREFGYLSGRARKLRLSISFVRSFWNLFSQTELCEANVKVEPCSFLNRQRCSLIKQDNQRAQPTRFTFIRNFSNEITSYYSVTVETSDRHAVKLTGSVPFKKGFVALGNYECNNGIQLLFSTVPIYFQTSVGDDQVFIVQSDSACNGEMCFEGVTTLYGNAVDSESRVGNALILRIGQPTLGGWIGLESCNRKMLYLIVLPESQLYTLSTFYENEFFTAQNSGQTVCSSSPQRQLRSSTRNTTNPATVSATMPTTTTRNPRNTTAPTRNTRKIPVEAKVFWGMNEFYYDSSTDSVDILKSANDTYLLTISSKCPPGFSAPPQEHWSTGLPFIYQKEIHTNTLLYKALTHLPVFEEEWRSRTCDFSSFHWKKCPTTLKQPLTPLVQTFELGLNSGHVFYRIKFTLNSPSQDTTTLTVNARHRITVYLNGKAIGGHLTYSILILRPGSKFGPDRQSGQQTYNIKTSDLLLHDENELVIQVESFGYNRQAFVFDDIRNPRGLIHASITNATVAHGGLEVCGVDTATLTNAFVHCGFPDEAKTTFTNKIKTKKGNSVTLLVDPCATPQWFMGKFKSVVDDGQVVCPVRLKIEGLCTCFVWINNVMIARYYGNGDSPQSNFYVMDGLVKDVVNTIKLLVYDGRSNDDKLTISFNTWSTKTEPLHERWSGNQSEQGYDHVYSKHNLKLC